MDTILKNSKFNKFFAIIAALLVAVSFSLTSVSAAGVPTGSVTVNNVEAGATVNLYQIATVNWNDTNSQPVEPMYKWVAEVASFIDTKSDYSTYKNSDGYVTDVFKSTAAKDEKAFLEDVFANAGLESATETGTVPVGAESVIIDGVDAGLYLIEVVKPGESKTKLTYQITTVELLPEHNGTSWTVSAATVNVKSVPDGSTKEVTDDDKTVAVGDTVNYKITTSVPSYPITATETSKTFTVRDVLGKGLTLNENSIQINGDDLTDDIASLTQNPVENSFTLTFTNAYITNNQGKQVVITYSVTVNENAFEEDALGNKAYVGTNDPTTGSDYEEKIQEVDVYTYGITVKKVNSKSEILSGAAFELKSGDTVLNFTSSDGVYTYSPTATKETTTTLVTNDAGEIKIQGIDTGEYTLTEIKAPDGYVLPANPDVTITLVDEAGSEDGKLDSTSNASGTIVNQTITDTPDDNVLELGVTNKTSDEAGFELPNTGGMGTLIFTVGGILLMAGAVIFLVVSKKKA